MRKALIIILLGIVFYPGKIYAQDYFSWKGRIVSSQTSEPIPGAYIKVISNGRSFLFGADGNGYVEIFYINPIMQDSVLVSSIGYRKLLVPKDVVFSQNTIMLQEESTALGEVIVRPKKVKHLKLGNLALFTSYAAMGMFGGQEVLYIPCKENKGKITQIRFFMTDPMFSKFNGMKNYPFRVRLYGRDTVNSTIGKDLLKENLIVSLNKGNWLEVDISSYNIDLPEGGVYAGLEILPSEYYINKKIISKTEIGKHRIINAVSIGFTRRSENSKKEFESWNYIPNVGWSKSKIDYLINIIVEL